MMTRKPNSLSGFHIGRDRCDVSAERVVLFSAAASANHLKGKENPGPQSRFLKPELVEIPVSIRVFQVLAFLSSGYFLMKLLTAFSAALYFLSASSYFFAFEAAVASL